MDKFREVAADDAADVLKRLGTSPWQIALVVTGGGVGAVASCFRRSGASVNFVEATVPYSKESLQDYLGSQPIQGSASEATAIQAASIAFNRAGQLGTGRVDHAVGIALLAVLPTIPPRDDEYRICVAMKWSGGCECWTRVLDDHAHGDHGHDRNFAESVADKLMFTAIEKLLTLPSD